MAFMLIAAALCVLQAAENITAAEDIEVQEIIVLDDAAAAHLADRVWECSSYVRAFKTDIKLSSRDIYYADNSYESQSAISIKSPSAYNSVITFDNAIKGVWSVEGEKFITQASNGSERDEMFITELTNDRFTAKTSSGLERVCEAKAMKFDPEILVANSWKCTLDEEFDEPNTYIKMESVNKYSSNGTSEVDAVIKLKLDPTQSELSYSIAYDEKWSYENGRFKTETGTVTIKNITQNDNSTRAFEEMTNLENIFKKGAVDDMEILLFEKEFFVLQDLSSLGEERSRYSCKKIFESK
jgi:hypothetical protein